MKLAEALLLRADIQKKLSSLQVRAQKYAVVQEGERPAEDPKELLRQIEAVAGELQQLVFAINRRGIPPHSGRVVGSAESSIPSLHNRAQQRAPVIVHRVHDTTTCADVASHSSEAATAIYR